MKLSKSTFLILTFLLTAISGFAQVPVTSATPKPKTAAKPTPKIAPKVSPTPKPTPKSDELEGLFDFLDDETFKNTKPVDTTNKKRAEDFFNKGMAFWKNLDISEAIDSYSKAIEIYPDYIDALRERGRIRMMIGKNKEAIPDLSAFLKTQPNNVDFLNMRGLAYTGITEQLLDDEGADALINDNGNKALDDFNAALKISPNSVNILTNRGKLFIDFDSLKEAIADLEKAVSLDNKNALAYTNLGLAKFYTDSLSGLPELNRAVELDPKSAVSYYNRGNFYRKSYNLDKAIADYTKAILLHGMEAKHYNARGMAYYAIGDGISAVKDFSTAVAQKPTFARAYYNRAMTYKKYPASAADKISGDSVFEGIAQQYQKMTKDLNWAIKYNPNLADAYIERGLMRSTSTGINIDGLDAETINELNLALADFEKATKLNPQSAEAFNGRASCYDQLGKKDSALADYNKAIQLNPRLVTAYMGRMGIYCKMGKKELSIADEKKVRELGFPTINVCNLGK